MVSINWCFNTKKGLEIIEPNENMSISYMKMAEESMSMIKKNEESRIWTASTSYYTMYYALYSLMMKIGIKCEMIIEKDEVNEKSKKMSFSSQAVAPGG